MTSRSFRIGALVPLTPPGWAEAGQQLLAGLELGVRDVNAAGGIDGQPLELVVRDTAADPERAAAAVDELAELGVLALAGEYHSVVARAVAARADARRVPFLCSSAVLDSLTDGRSDWVARIAPPQSRGWRVFAEFLIAAGHRHIAVALQPSVYWTSGARIVRECLAAVGGSVLERDAGSLTLADELAGSGATVLLLLAGYPEPAVSIVSAVRRDGRLTEVLIGAPAGQPEFGEWVTRLGEDGAGVPFLRYLREPLEPLAARVAASLRERLAATPSFVAFEGYDTVAVLAEIMWTGGTDRAGIAGRWSTVVVDGTRGRISLSRAGGSSTWQWAAAPIQVVDRDPAAPDRFRVRHTG